MSKNQNPKKWKVAKAQRPTPQELKEVIKGKQVERIQRQKKYRGGILQLQLKRATLLALKKTIDHFQKSLPEPAKTEGLIEFGAFKYPLEVWKCEYNSQLHNLALMEMEVNHLYSALKNDGLTVEQINDIVEKKKYIKDENTK